MALPDARPGEAQHPNRNTVSENTDSSVCLMSYNSRGSSEQKMQFIKYLVSSQCVGNKIPILFNQENFLLKSNSYKLFQVCPEFQFFINPAIKDVQDTGRPSNGMFICVPNRIKGSVIYVSPGHWRVQAVKIESETSQTLLINSYFPFDRRGVEGSIDGVEDELIETLSVIRNVILNNECDTVIWGGDINSDFARNNRLTGLVTELLEEINLATTWNTFEADFTCVYEREGVSHVSLLDHFFISEGLSPKIIEAGVIHHPDNTSDHSPIFCVLNSITISQSSTEAAPGSKKPSWKRASALEKESCKQLLEAR